MEASQLMHSLLDLSPKKPPLRKRKYDRRCTIKGPGNLHRMVSSSSNGSTDLQCSGHSTHRPVCIPSQQPVTNLLFLPCQSSGIEHQLEGDPGLYIPSNLSAPPCSREDRSSDMQDTSDRPFLAKTDMVSSTPGSPSPSTSGLAKAPRCPDTTNLQGTSSRSRQSSSFFLDAIKMSFQTAGLSDTALAAKSRRASTRKTYDNRLQHYIKWCSQKAVNPYSASLTDIGEFFVRLSDSRLQIATI